MDSSTDQREIKPVIWPFSPSRTRADKSTRTWTLGAPAKHFRVHEPPKGIDSDAYRTVTCTTFGGAKAPVTLLHGNTARS